MLMPPAKWLKLLFLLAIGLGVLTFSRCLTEMPLRHDLVRDLGIAIVISSLVTTFIEYQREQEIRRDAVDVFMGRVIPPFVWEDFRNHIITRQVICENWDLDIFFTKVKVSSNGGVQEQYVSTGTMIYKLNNLNNLVRREQIPSLKHELEIDLSGKDPMGRTLPRFVQVTWTSATGEQKSWDESQLSKFVKGEKFELPNTELPAKSSGPVEIVVKRKELIPIPGGFPWYMNWITLKCKITVRTNVDGLTFDLWPRHHQHEKFRPLVPGDTWSFDGVMFPGQGFEIQCRLNSLPPQGPASPSDTKRDSTVSLPPPQAGLPSGDTP